MSRPETDRIKFWTKDGAYHVALRYIPTSQDRRQFPASYPPGDDGPFYKWSGGAFATFADAVKFEESMR